MTRMTADEHIAEAEQLATRALERSMVSPSAVVLSNLAVMHSNLAIAITLKEGATPSSP